MTDQEILDLREQDRAERNRQIPIELIEIDPDPYEYTYEFLKTKKLLRFRRPNSRPIDTVWMIRQQSLIHQISDILVLGGGAVTGKLTDCAYNDFDFFFLDDGVDPNDRVDEVIQLIDDSNEKIEYITQSKLLTTIKLFNGPEIQLIHRVYQSVGEIISGFDLGCCACAFYRGKYYMTRMGDFCLRHRCNIVDPKRRSTTYESRLLKYYYRGYGIVFIDGDFDIYYVGSQNRREPSIKIFESEKELEVYLRHQQTFPHTDNPIYVRKRYNIEVTLGLELPFVRLQRLAFDTKYKNYSDYDTNIVKQSFYRYYAKLHNYQKLAYLALNGYVEFRKYDPWKCNEFINKKFSRVKDTIPEQKVLWKICHHSLTDKYKDIWLHLMEKDINLANKLAPELFTLQTEAMMNNDTALGDCAEWNYTDPQTQIVGSFNPIISDVVDWYGEYCEEYRVRAKRRIMEAWDAYIIRQRYSNVTGEEFVRYKNMQKVFDELAEEIAS